MAKFGERRLSTGSALHRLQYRLTGVLDPAHYLHHRYVTSMLGRHANGRLREILDAGCGGGDHTLYMARRYADAAVLGIDRNSESIQRNAEVAVQLEISNVRFEVGDLTTLPFESRFDLVICIDVLEHIPNQTGVLRNLAHALVPKGRLLLHMPLKRPRPVPFSNHIQEFHDWAAEEHIAQERTFDELQAMVLESGLSVIAAQRTFGFWTGELATSLFAIPYRNTPLNRVAQFGLGLPCRLLALADQLELDSPRFAACLLAQRP